MFPVIPGAPVCTPTSLLQRRTSWSRLPPGSRLAKWVSPEPTFRSLSMLGAIGPKRCAAGWTTPGRKPSFCVVVPSGAKRWPPYGKPSSSSRRQRAPAVQPVSVKDVLDPLLHGRVGLCLTGELGHFLTGTMAYRSGLAGVGQRGVIGDLALLVQFQQSRVHRLHLKLAAGLHFAV
jgi:hypothetical protein